MVVLLKMKDKNRVTENKSAHDYRDGNAVLTSYTCRSGISSGEQQIMLPAIPEEDSADDPQDGRKRCT